MTCTALPTALNRLYLVSRLDPYAVPSMPSLRAWALRLLVVAITAWSWLAAAPAARAGTLDDIRQRGTLLCGVTDEASGYSVRDGKGEWSGLAVDFCRALAVAVLGKREAVEFREASAATRIGMLQAQAIDILSTDAAITSMRDTSDGIRFPGVLAYGGQGFLVRKAHGIASALELSGSRVCVWSQTNDDQGVLDYFAGLKIPVELVKLERWQDVVAAYNQKTCQVLSASIARIAGARSGLGTPAGHMLLPEMAAKHAYGPAIRQGDETWFSVVRWTLHALVAAEELGINAGNADQLRTTGSPEIKRFLSGGAELCAHLALAPDWTKRVVQQVGNYGEIFERNLGTRSAVGLDRGRNNLAAKGGLHFAPSFR